MANHMTNRNVFRKQAKVLKALANESRLMIVDRNRGECSVGELTELVGSDVSTVSKHLALLRAHGSSRTAARELSCITAR